MPQVTSGYPVYMPDILTPGQQQDALAKRETERLTLQLLSEKRRQELQQMQQEQDTNQFLQDAMQRHTDPQTGMPDWEAIKADAYRYSPQVGAMVERQDVERQKGLIDLRVKKLDDEIKSHQVGQSIFDRIVDQRSLDIYGPELQSVDPNLRAVIGTTFNPEVMDKLKELNLKEVDRLDRLKVRYGNNPNEGILHELATAPDQETWDSTFDGVAALYNPKVAAALKQGIGDFTPENQQRLQTMLGQTGEKTANQQAKEFMVNGKSVMGTFDPGTGHYFYNGEDVTGQARPIPPASAAGGVEPQVEPPIDPTSQNILSQTGLNINAFRYLTGQAAQLPRDAATRARAARDAETWARAHNVDISTMAAQYKAYNDVLNANISRLNNTKIMESELEGTIDNLRNVVKDADLGKLRVANVAKVWAGQEVNDSLAQQYALHLGQLRNELSAYYAATQGRTGNNITMQDQRDAEMVIKNGLSTGSLTGLRSAIQNSTQKMGTVMQGSVERARKEVWSLFGVGQNYQGSGGSSGPVRVQGKDGKTYEFPDQKSADAFKKAGG